MIGKEHLRSALCRFGAAETAGGVVVEYAIIAALVALAIMGALMNLGNGLANLPLPEISNAMADALS